MTVFYRLAGLSLRMRNSEVWEELKVEPPLHIGRSQLRWFGHVIKMGGDLGQIGEVLSLGWPGNTLGFHLQTWCKGLGRNVWTSVLRLLNPTLRILL